MIVAMFPGQGSQAVGMGQDLASAYDVARRTFEEADDVLGYALSEICFSGPAERLTATDVCQPALLATSVAAFRVAQEVGLAPGLVLGHSLGEYSALVAGGAMDYATALRTVAERGAAMREAGRAAPGGMAALLGPTDDEARALAEEAGEVWAANFNCPRQVVVSGSEAGIDRVVALAGERGVRVARLAVDGPFHSPLIAPAAERLRPALEEWEPSVPDPPFLSTTTCALEPPERMRRGAAGPAHLAGALRRRRAGGGGPGRRALRGAGPGRVLSGLVRRIRRDLPTAQVGEPGDLAALVDAISVAPAGALVPVALVTGASRGIGAAIARALAADGFDVAVGYAADAEGAADDGVSGRGPRAARGRTAGRRRGRGPGPGRSSRRAEEALGPLDAVVLNAGITRDGLAVRMSAEDWSAVIDTNLSGAFYTARPALRGMLRRRAGSIVAVSSVVGIIGNAGQVNYAAAKAGMLGMVRALAREAGSPRRPCQRRRSRLHRHRHDGGAQPTRSARACWPQTPLGRLGDAGGRRGRRGVPLLARRRLHHGRHPVGRRRAGDVMSEPHPRRRARASGS